MECSHGVVMRAEVTHGSPNFSVCSALIFFQVLCVAARGFLVLLLDDAECLVWSPRMSDYCPVLHSCVVLFSAVCGLLGCLVVLALLWILLDFFSWSVARW